MATLEEIKAERARRAKLDQVRAAKKAKQQGATFQGQDIKQGAYGDPISTMRPPVTKEELERQDKTFEGVVGIPGAIGTMGTAAIAEHVAGLAGIAGAVLPGDEGQGARWVEGTRDALTNTPGEKAQGTLSALGSLFEGVPDIGKAAGDFAFELTGSPLIAAAAASTPTLIGELIGLKGIKALRPGTKLIDKAGNPTKKLKKALDKKGLDFDSLSPEARKTIPDEITPGFIATDTVGSKAEDALIKQMQTGGTENVLAGVDIVDGKLVSDSMGQEAMKQGFEPGFVQGIKASSPDTKKKMAEMSSKMRQIKKNDRAGLDFRPTDVIGESVGERLKYIRDVASNDGKQLDRIAKTNLDGLTIDSDSVLESFEDALFDLDVKLETKPNGKVAPIFEGSLISKDTSSQRAVKSAIDLLSEGETPDALRAHKLKRQLDNLIDYKKKSAGGLANAGKNVLKDLRSSLNDAIREVDPEYATINDRLSTALTAMGDLDKSVGTIDIFGKGSDKAIGQKMRALLSQQQGRVRLENAVDGINDAVKKLGGNFDDDIKDLVMFANGLDKRFGSVAETSFAGQISQAMEEGARRVDQGGISKGGIVSEALRAGSKGVEKMRGINDFNAFESIDALLKK